MIHDYGLLPTCILQVDLKYRGTAVHRIVKDFVVQMGDTTVGDGTGGTPQYYWTTLLYTITVQHNCVNITVQHYYFMFFMHLSSGPKGMLNDS